MVGDSTSERSQARARTAFTLLEVLMAGVILVITLIPILSLTTASSAGVIKTRDRTLAVELASSVLEWVRSLPPLQRRSFPAKRITELPSLVPLLERYRAEKPEDHRKLQGRLETFLCEVRLDGPVESGRASVCLTWTEAGDPQSYVLEGVLTEG